MDAKTPILGRFRPAVNIRAHGLVMNVAIFVSTSREIDPHAQARPLAWKDHPMWTRIHRKGIGQTGDFLLVLVFHEYHVNLQWNDRLLRLRLALRPKPCRQ